MKTLPKATIATMRVATEQAAKFPRALVAFASSSHCYCGSADDESVLKHQWLMSAGVLPHRWLDAGPITNSVTEARAIRAAVARRFESCPKEILLICEHFHAWFGAVDIWEQEFPCAVSLMKVSAPGYQYDHIFPGQQTFPAYFIAGWKRRAGLNLMGPNWVAKHQHRPATT